MLYIMVYYEIHIKHQRWKGRRLQTKRNRKGKYINCYCLKVMQFTIIVLALLLIGRYYLPPLRDCTLNFLSQAMLSGGNKSVGQMLQYVAFTSKKRWNFASKKVWRAESRSSIGKSDGKRRDAQVFTRTTANSQVRQDLPHCSELVHHLYNIDSQSYWQSVARVRIQIGTREEIAKTTK